MITLTGIAKPPPPDPDPLHLHPTKKKKKNVCSLHIKRARTASLPLTANLASLSKNPPCHPPLGLVHVFCCTATIAPAAARRSSWWWRLKNGDFYLLVRRSTQPCRNREQSCGCQLRQRCWSIVEACDGETEQHSGSWIHRGCSAHTTTWLPRSSAKRRTTICLTSFIPVSKN